ncbi:MAG TPA: formate dehydrogenase subunit delta [Burkholderiaceae bacterium]|nr:formate dehydrogenase subunit delta [Burkholderiaceae bacterium]
MNVEHLVTMANQIGAFFVSQSDREAAINAIADHLRRFWEPRMRQAILRHVAAGGQGLREEVAEAVRRLAPLPDATAPGASPADNEPGAGPTTSG